MNEISTDLSPLPPFRMGEVGTLGINTIGGRVLQESRRNLRFPESIKTFQLMMRDPAIAASINIIKMMARRVRWEFKAPEGMENDPLIIQRLDFFNGLMGDLDVSWNEFITSVMSMCIYGFSVHEKVYKKRTGKSGKYPSKYNDNLIGWAKLPIRSQTTLDKWYFDDDYTQVIGVRQNLYQMNRNMTLNTSDGFRRLPRSKFLLFKYDENNGSPEGRSPLLNAYVSWKYKVQIEEYEAVGVSRDLVGMPKIGLPLDYLDPNAEPEKKDFVEYCKNIINDMIANDRAGLIFPRYVDPETKIDAFDFSLVSRSGAKAYDTEAIIERYSKQIMQAFMADVIAMGNSKYGSFSLADSKTSLLAMSVEVLLNQVKDVINRDLVPQTYTLNQWSDEEHVTISFTDIETPDLEVISKFIQQVVAVGAMEVDKTSSNFLRGLIGLPPAIDGEKLSEELLPNTDSKSGEGYKTGGDGTAKKPSGNSSAANKSNK